MKPFVALPAGYGTPGVVVNVETGVDVTTVDTKVVLSAADVVMGAAPEVARGPAGRVTEKCVAHSDGDTSCKTSVSTCCGEQIRPA